MTVLTSARRLLAGGTAVAATLGVAAAVGASPAAASGSFVGQNITGSGSSLQGVAQGFLPTGYLSWTGGQLTSQPSIAYTSTSSGQGLAEFGDAGETITICGTSHTFNAGTLNPGASGQSIANCESPDVFDGFAGTDDAPTTSLISSGESAANTGTTASVKQMTLPILQAPVSVDFALPELVTLNSTDNLKLENVVLDNLWSDNIAPTATYPGNTWGAFLQAAGFSPITSGTPTATQFLDTGSSTAGTGGYTPITLAARSSGSGTTFTFRSYLNEVEEQRFGSTFSSYVYNDGDVSDTNAEATSTTGGWPVTVTETAGTSAGGGLVNYVHSNPGTVGYANLADAIGSNGPFTNEPVTVGSGSTAYQVLYAQVQDNGVGTTGTIRYADPSASPSAPTTHAGNVYGGSNEGNLNTGGTQAPGSGAGAGVGFWTVPTTADGSWAGTPVWGQDPYNTTSTPQFKPQQGEVAAPNDPDVFVDGSETAATASYPIVAATYDLIWSAYNGSSNVATTLSGEGKTPFEVGNTVKDYFTYVLGTGGSQGQVTIDTQGYAPLPSTIANDATTNQLSALSYATS